MGLIYFRYSWAQWYPLEIEIHPYSYVQSRLHSNLRTGSFKKNKINLTEKASKAMYDILNKGRVHN
jgi:hypothetical protein